MIVTRRFDHKDDPEMGGKGWMPTWLGPKAGSVYDMGFAHDALDHQLHDDLSMEMELMATGCYYLLRGDTGWWCRNGASYKSASHWAAGSAGFILERHRWGEGDLSDPGQTRPVEHYDEALRECAKLSVENCRAEWDNGGDDDEHIAETDRLLSPEFERRILGWLRRGVRYAQRRYKDCDIYSLSYLWDRMGKLAKTLPDDEEIVDGSLILHFDCKQIEIRHTMRDYRGMVLSQS